MTRKKQSITLVHSVKRFIFSQWIVNLVVAGVEPRAIQFSAGSINRHAVRLVGPPQGPTQSIIAEDPRIISSLSSGQSGRVGSSIAFFSKIKLRSRFAAINKSTATDEG